MNCDQMNCDQVFAVLTRGPFPSGAPEDLAVERHLETCPSCWRIAEALRPASDVFQEAIPPGEGLDLPGYWGDASPPGVVLAEVSANVEGQAGSREPRRPVTLAIPARAQAVREATYHARSSRTGWRDVAQVAGFLALVASTACGLSWLLG